MAKKNQNKVEQQNTQTNQQMNQHTNKQNSNLTDYVTVPTQKKNQQAQNSHSARDCR